MRRILLIFLIGICVIVLHSTTLFAKNSFKIPLQYDGLLLDPAKYPDTDSIWISTQIYEGLFELSPNGEIRPRLATDWQISQDGKTLNLSLRKNVRFSDGSPYTAKDIAFTLKRLLRNSTRENALLKTIKEIKILNDYKLQLKFTHPLYAFPNILSSPHYYILPAKYAQQIEAGSFFKKPIGTGPYTIKKWNHQKNIVLKRNDHHWDGAAHINEIIFSFENPKHPWTRAEMMEFDLQLGIPAYNLNVPIGFQSQWYNHPTIEFLGFNLQHPFWRKFKHRQAFTMLFNKEDYYKTMFKNRQKSWHLTNSIIPYGMLGPSKLFTFAKKIPNSLLVKTKQRLESEKDSIFFSSHDHLPSTLIQESISVAFKNSISNKLVARTVNYPELLKKLSNAEAGIFIMRLVADSSDPFEIMVYFSKDAPHNFTGYENNTFTASLRKARTVTDDNQKIAIYGQLATQLNKDLIILPLASMYNERLFIRENCTLNNLGPLGPRYYRLSQITCN